MLLPNARDLSEANLVVGSGYEGPVYLLDYQADETLGAKSELRYVGFENADTLEDLKNVESMPYRLIGCGVRRVLGGRGLARRVRLGWVGLSWVWRGRARQAEHHQPKPYLPRCKHSCGGFHSTGIDGGARGHRCTSAR